MSRHMKKRQISGNMRTAMIVSGSVIVVILLCVLVIGTGLLDKVATVFSPSATDTSSTTASSTHTTQSTLPPEPDPVYAFPEEMKGVWLTPGTDYLTSDKDTVATVKKQIDAAFETIEEWQFNTLLLPMHKDTEALYPSQLLESRTLKDGEGAVFEPLQYILTLAREKKLFVYGMVNLHVRDEELWDPRKEEDMDRIVQVVTEQVSRYDLDGYFLSGFTFAGKQVPEGEEAVAEQALDTMMTRVTEAIRKTDRDLYVGLLSNGVWAHKSVDERGSETGEYYEEMTDGRADTLSWIKQGLFNCVLVQDYTSTNHPTAPFQKILSWWSGVAREQQIPLYISHSASTIGSYKVGWKLTDQLAQQYLYCKSESAWQGSAYDTLSALKTDKSGIAETLKKAYAGTLDEAFIYKTLTVTSPQKTSYTTTSSTVKFEGGGDTNFPLLINGKEVELTEHGFFTETYTLSIGVNTFEFSHKGITRKYTVTYKQTLLESVSPSQNMDVDGGNPFIISAVAREGSTVKATLGKQTITLSAVPNKDDENTGEESDFQTYSGSLTLPKGTVGADQALGAVSVTATYNGLSETVKGGKITVNGLPVPATTTTVTSPTGGVIPVPDDKGNYEIVVITADYAETFNGGKYTDVYSRPYNSYLPQGTWDYLAGKVYNGSFSYYLLSSGKRVYMKDAKVITAGELKQQELKNGSAAVNGSHTVFTFESAWRVPVYVEAAPQKYYRDSGTPHYGIENYGQTAEYVDVTFHHVTEVPAAPDLSDNPLFSKAEWKAVNANTYTLRLTLRKKGGFYGFSPVWSGDGTLTLSFLNPVDISKNSGEEKLKGIRILIDPGHGSPDDKPWEAPFNLDYANTLKEKLEALGATVEMTRTGPLTTELSLPARTQMAHNKQYHMFISVHMNGANGKATGATVWYYHEYAYTASKYIYDKMHAAETPDGVGTSANGTPRSSGTNWGTLYLNRTIHDCPAVLLECAFLDNPLDKECLIDPIYRDKLMQAVTDGVVAYFSSQA